MEGERRQWKRYKLNSYPLAMVSDPHALSSVFSNRVIDISEAGMAFSYIGWEQWPKEQYRMELIDEDIYLDGFPVTVISDIALDGNLSYRRCGVQFKNLTSSQKATLQNYIKKKTVLDIS